jgi:high-affinity Fe2+/Pb2+ permease
MQELGWLPVLDSPMWHTTSLLSQGSAFGDVMHSFFGYSDAPTPLQLVVYAAYLAVVIVTYLGLRSRTAAGRSTASKPRSAPEAERSTVR